MVGWGGSAVLGSSLTSCEWEGSLKGREETDTHEKSTPWLVTMLRQGCVVVVGGGGCHRQKGAASAVHEIAGI